MTGRGTALIAAFAVALCAPAAAGAAPSALAQRVEAAVRPLGASVSVQVTDLSARRRVVAVRAGRRRSLGSTTKLLTAAAALRRLGPAHVLGTQALGAAPARCATGWRAAARAARAAARPARCRRAA